MTLLCMFIARYLYSKPNTFASSVQLWSLTSVDICH